jgi:hypothetical protein
MGTVAEKIHIFTIRHKTIWAFFREKIGLCGLIETADPNIGIFRVDYLGQFEAICLKGQCHEIFNPWFVSSKHPSWAPD